MRVIKECINCGEVLLIRSRDLCHKCYHRDYYLRKKEQIDEWRKGWWPAYYQKNKERQAAYSTQYRKTEKHKAYKRKYDYDRRNQKRFGGNRDKALERANWQCEICGSASDLHVHHKDGNSYHNGVPNNKLDNLMVVCMTCHYSKVHETRGPLKEKTKRKISEKKRQRDLAIKEIKNSHILSEGTIRQCKLCGLISKHNSVINAIALDDNLDFMPQYREAHALSIEDRKQIGPGIHFICRAVRRCLSKRTA